MRRGEVWWAELPEPAGGRPVLILSRDAACQVRSYLTVAPVTRTARGIATEVSLGPPDGMPEECVVNLDDIQTVRKSYLGKSLAVLSRDRMHEVREAILFALDLRT